MGAVDEAVGRHVVERARLGEVLEHRRVAAGDHGLEAVEQAHELVAALDDPLVVIGHVEAGVLVADLHQRRLEVLEIAPHVAVVRAEPGEVDVGQEEHVADPEPAVTAGVAGEVDGLDGDATAEIEDVPVLEALGVGPRRVVELLEDGRRERVVDGHPVDVHQALQAVGAEEVLVVDVDAGVGEEAVAGEVVLVAVAVDDGIDAHRRPAALDDGDRGVDDQRLAGASHEQRVARRVGAVGRADEHAHRVRQPSLVVSPVHGPCSHGSTVPVKRPGARRRRTGCG